MEVCRWGLSLRYTKLMAMSIKLTTLLAFSSSLLLILYIRTISNTAWADYLGAYYRNSVISPFEYFSLICIVISIYVLFFNPTIQQSWWCWARFVLFVPIALILILLPTYSGGGGFISFSGTTELVILWGVVFGFITVVHTPLYHRFYLKTGT